MTKKNDLMKRALIGLGVLQLSSCGSLSSQPESSSHDGQNTVITSPTFSPDDVEMEERAESEIDPINASGGHRRFSGVGEQDKGHCLGVNSCKGLSNCSGQLNSCKGLNACKGQGWFRLGREECEDQGGEFQP